MTACDTYNLGVAFAATMTTLGVVRSFMQRNIAKLVTKNNSPIAITRKMLKVFACP